ncbi:MAG: entericidin, EcnA/B family [Rhodospirillales bacterium]|nr:MAG: entericidin, EcnA/B family [Rhodospirillales bacterium]
MIRSTLSRILPVLGALTLAACGTVQGIGQDISNTAAWVGKTVF